MPPIQHTYRHVHQTVIPSVLCTPLSIHPRNFLPTPLTPLPLPFPLQAYWFPKTPPGELQGDVNEGPEAIQIVVVEVESTRQPPPPPPNAMHHHHHMHPAPVGGY